mgnify:CR=1 FL=1|tara:strand:- start:426 stop:671 length:246 start_codon:yes stop_codon:yes gene_type:complete
MALINKIRKNDKIVRNVIVKEEIKFQGKIIIRERIKKQWKIPKVITNDIGFQLLFGFDPPAKISRKLKDIASKEYSINHKI